MVKAFVKQYDTEQILFKQIYFESGQKCVESIETCSICPGMLLEVMSGQAVNFDIAVLSSSHSNISRLEGSFTSTIGRTRSERYAVAELKRTQLNKISGQIIKSEDNSIHLKLDSHKNKIQVKNENMMNVGEKLEGCDYIYGLVLATGEHNFTKNYLYNLKSPLDFDFFISIYTYFLTSVILMSSLGFIEFNLTPIERVCELCTFLIMAYHLK